MIHNWLLSSGHFQTIWGPIWRRPPHVDRKRYRLLTEDRDFIHIDVQDTFEADASVMDSDVGVIIWHGLTGSSNSHYVLGLQENLTVRKILSVAVNHRGCSGEANWLARGYHAGDYQDIDFAVKSILKRYPGRRWVLCGYSLGGSMLINWLSRAQVPEAVVGAVGVSVPFELGSCSDYVNTGFAKVYRNWLLKGVQKQIIDKKQSLSRVAPDEFKRLHGLGDVERFQDFKTFDHEFVAPLHGFDSGEHYYASSSVRSQLLSVSTPLALVHSRDDPLMPPEVIPSPSELHENTYLHCEEAGGHLGFLRINRLGMHYWLDEVVAKVAEAMLDPVQVGAPAITLAPLMAADTVSLPPDMPVPVSANNRS